MNLFPGHTPTKVTILGPFSTRVTGHHCTSVPFIKSEQIGTGLNLLERKVPSLGQSPGGKLAEQLGLFPLAGQIAQSTSLGTGEDR